MKKVLLSAGMLVGLTATAQNDHRGRMGINTQTPRASLEVKSQNDGRAQGILFPHISETEKARWAQDDAKGLVAGTVIWNTTKQCLDYFDGTKWTCTDGTKSNVHPTPWTPGATSFTGRAIWGDGANEKINVRKNNCPSGQSGVPFDYPVNASQHITYTATSTVSQADADQKALDLMNSTAKQQERQTIAQTYANNSGTCESSVPPNTQVSLPSGITIANGEHWIASILDDNYLPYTLPTAPASWTEKTNPNTTGTDTNIDVKGIIPETGISIKIPVIVTGATTLPAYKTYVITVEEAWKDNIPKVLELSWEQKVLTSNIKEFDATIRVYNATTSQELTQLDMRNGMGNDYRGLLLGQFKMPKNNTETTPTDYTATYDVRVISGIPDRKFGIKTNGILEHQFIYVPKMALNGHVILNHNLGAEYTRIDSPHFNPAASDVGLIDGIDKYAIGSLFQWGRQSDGHELIDITTMKSKYGWTEIDNGNTSFVNSKTPLMMSSDLYRTERNRTVNYNQLYSPTGAGNPCPIGWAPLTKSFYDDFETVHLSRLRKQNQSNGVYTWDIPTIQEAEELRKAYPFFETVYYRSSCCTNREGQVDNVSSRGTWGLNNGISGGRYNMHISPRTSQAVMLATIGGGDETDGRVLRCEKVN